MAMPNERFNVTLNGLEGAEIADYALRMMPCIPCHVVAGVRCDTVTPGRPVCRSRFTAAVKGLGAVAEFAVRCEFDRTEEPADADTPKKVRPMDDSWDESWATAGLGNTCTLYSVSISIRGISVKTDKPELSDWQKRLRKLLRGHDEIIETDDLTTVIFRGNKGDICTCDECTGIGQDGLS